MCAQRVIREGYPTICSKQKQQMKIKQFNCPLPQLEDCTEHVVSMANNKSSFDMPIF
jgi:hypothetical protein